MKKPITYIDAAVLLEKDLGPQKWLIPGLITEGVTLVASPPKLGKTFFCVNLAVAVSQGMEVFDAFEVAPTTVLYLFLEGTERSKKERIMALAPDGLLSDKLLVAYDWSTGVDACAGLKEVLNSRPDIGLVIVDTYQLISDDSGSGNAYQKEYHRAAELVRVFQEASVNALLIHHDRKNNNGSLDPFDSISGSYGLQAAVDNIIKLQRKGDGTIKLLARGRDLEEMELVFSIQWPEGKWILNGERPQNLVSKERHLVEKALGVINAPAGPSAIYEQATQLGYPSSLEAIKKLLRAMTDDPRSKVTQKTRGKYELLTEDDSPPSPPSPWPKVSEVREVSVGAGESVSASSSAQTQLFA